MESSVHRAVNFGQPQCAVIVSTLIGSSVPVTPPSRSTALIRISPSLDRRHPIAESAHQAGTLIGMLIDEVTAPYQMENQMRERRIDEIEGQQPPSPNRLDIDCELTSIDAPHPQCAVSDGGSPHLQDRGDSKFQCKLQPTGRGRGTDQGTGSTMHPTHDGQHGTSNASSGVGATSIELWTARSHGFASTVAASGCSRQRRTFT